MSIIPFDDRDGWIWMNGEMVEWRNAQTHILNHGLHYASSVFEGIRVYGGNIFKLTEHSERLIKSAEILDFKIPYTVEELNAATKAIVAKQGVVDGYIRPVAWRGSEMMAIAAQHNKTHVAIATWEWPNLFKGSAKENGIRVKTASWKRPSPETAPCASKAAGLYMICTMSKHEAEREGFHDALMHDWRGYVAELTGANLFFRFGDELHTPKPDCFLDGITRRTVKALAEKDGITVVERHIKPEELKDATEAFATGTAAEVTPIASIDDIEYGVGNMTKGLQQAYMELVRQPSE